MIGALLLGLASVGPALADDHLHQTVYLDWDAGLRSCAARVDGRRVGDPMTDEGEAALVAALSEQSRIVQLQEMGRVPYRCVDTVTAALRRSGHAIKIGFVSEPAAR